MIQFLPVNRILTLLDRGNMMVIPCLPVAGLGIFQKDCGQAAMTAIYALTAGLGCWPHHTSVTGASLPEPGGFACWLPAVYIYTGTA